jgi:hypothetical protein
MMSDLVEQVAMRFCIGSNDILAQIMWSEETEVRKNWFREEVRSITALVIEDIAIKIENRCRELLHDTEWIGYETIILCAECQSIIDAIRAPRGVGE